MLRITRTTKDETVWLTLEGKLAGPWVDECRDAFRRESPAASNVVLDLARVTFIDSPGLALLRDALREGMRLRACSSFVAELLRPAAK